MNLSNHDVVANTGFVVLAKQCYWRQNIASIGGCLDLGYNMDIGDEGAITLVETVNYGAIYHLLIHV